MKRAFIALSLVTLTSFTALAESDAGLQLSAGTM
jgi:hypothetical protein